MTIHATPHSEHMNSPVEAPDGRNKKVPVVRSRVGGPVAFAGLALALVSLFVPWLSGAGQGISGLGLTETLDLRAMAPLNFLGLLVLGFLTSVTLFTRLGIFAILNAVTATLVLVAHLGFVWVLVGSTGTAEPILAGLPAEMSITYGPFLAAVGFVLVIVGSAIAAMSAEYLMPDRAEARLLNRD